MTLLYKLDKIPDDDYCKVQCRIEDCIVNAKCSQSKRLLYRLGLYLQHCDYVKVKQRVKPNLNRLMDWIRQSLS